LDLSDFKKCDVVFSHCNFGTPLPMLLLGLHIRALQRNNRHVKFTYWTRNGNFRGYADHIGFFRFCGIDRGNQIGEAHGGNGYQPIRLFDLNSLREAAGEEPYAIIAQDKANELAGILTQNYASDLFQALQYSLREIIRNSMEHSQGGVLGYLAQYWPKLDKAELAVFDTGVGIGATLREVEELKDISDAEALQNALKPGVTSVSLAERAYQHPDARNSGFGLYLTSKVCADSGHLRVLSGSKGITCNAAGTTVHDWAFEGTCVQMSIQPSKVVGFASRFKDMVEEGQAIAGDENPASSYSKVINF
jgi:hypothetical protein